MKAHSHSLTCKQTSMQTHTEKTLLNKMDSFGLSEQADDAADGRTRCTRFGDEQNANRWLSIRWNIVTNIANTWKLQVWQQVSASRLMSLIGWSNASITDVAETKSCKKNKRTMFWMMVFGANDHVAIVYQISSPLETSIEETSRTNM